MDFHISIFYAETKWQMETHTVAFDLNGSDKIEF